MTVGETAITGLLEGEDVNQHRQGHAGARRNRGASWARELAGQRGRGCGVRGASAPLDFGNSGTGCRLVIGAVAGCPIAATFDGDASLRSRPMKRVLDPLERMGARAVSVAEGGRLPLSLAVHAIRSRSSTSRGCLRTAQIPVLLAGLAAPGETVVIEAEATRDHTERMLRHFGPTCGWSMSGAWPACHAERSAGTLWRRP